MYQVVCFHLDNKLQSVRRYWIKDDKQVCQLIYDGYMVYRIATDQLAILIGGEKLMWQDIKIEDAQIKE
jgi:hypothetical protein